MLSVAAVVSVEAVSASVPVASIVASVAGSMGALFIALSIAVALAVVALTVDLATAAQARSMVVVSGAVSVIKLNSRSNRFCQS